MGKYLLEALPAILLAIIVVKGAVWWYRKRFPKVLTSMKDMVGRTRYYNAELRKMHEEDKDA